MLQGQSIVDVFIYDDSFEGLLTCVFEAYRLKLWPQVVSVKNYQKGLFDESRTIETAADKADKVCAKLKELEEMVFYTVQYCYLSSDPQKERIILAYIRHTLSSGRNLNGNYADPIINEALAVMKKVTRETERLKGLLRFQELKDGSFYAACEPDHCVLPLLAEHCCGRFGAQDWLIHDVRRRMMLVYLKGELNLYFDTDVADPQDKYADAEQRYQQSWKTFYNNIAIKERINPKLQRQFMPKRYWKYLVEKN
jgi:probable DNA metabolism protein